MRALTTPMKAEILKLKLRPIVFVQIDFVTGSVFLWSGIGTLVWNGQSWLGVGNLGAISPLQETTQLTATNLSMSLSGIPADMLNDALLEIKQGKPAVIWLGAVDDNFNIVADPYQAFAGRVDTAVVDEGGETSTVTLTIENMLIDLQRAREIRFTDQAQQAVFPGDKGFEFVPSLQEKNLLWGVAGSNLASGGTGSSGSGGSQPRQGPPTKSGA